MHEHHGVSPRRALPGLSPARIGHPCGARRRCGAWCAMHGHCSTRLRSMNRPFPLSPCRVAARRDRSWCQICDARIASSVANRTTLSVHATSLSNIFARHACAHRVNTRDRIASVCVMRHRGVQGDTAITRAFSARRSARQVAGLARRSMRAGGSTDYPRPVRRHARPSR